MKNKIPLLNTLRRVVSNLDTIFINHKNAK